MFSISCDLMYTFLQVIPTVHGSLSTYITALSTDIYIYLLWLFKSLCVVLLFSIATPHKNNFQVGKWKDTGETSSLLMCHLWTSVLGIFTIINLNRIFQRDPLLLNPLLGQIKKKLLEKRKKIRTKKQLPQDEKVISQLDRNSFVFWSCVFTGSFEKSLVCSVALEQKMTRLKQEKYSIWYQIYLHFRTCQSEKWNHKLGL